MAAPGDAEDMKTLTHERAAELLDYAPATGALTWRKRASNNVKVGESAGSENADGSLSVMLDGKTYRAHHIVHLLLFGDFPAWPISHIDCNKANNRSDNLIILPRLKKEKDAVLHLPLLRRFLAYDPATGGLSANGIWPDAPPSHVTSHGYLVVSLLGSKIYMHRLAFLLMTGELPSGVMDHIDGDRLNNRWANLRDVTSRMNTENKRSAQPGNKSAGLLGVYFHKQLQRYHASIKSKGKKYSLGTYETAEEAHQAYLQAKRRLHAGCTI